MQLNRYEEIKKACVNEHSNRLFAQIDYLLHLNETFDKKYEDDLENALNAIINYYEKENTITSALVKKVENSLIHLSDIVKKLTVICIGHAHIDVNWQWGLDETVNITSTTFETMLYLMDHYKDFTFMQSQGYLYELMHRYRPDLIKRIKKYVKEGRWEVTASTYVENDNNMIDANSSNKQFEYSKKRVSEILGIDQNSLDIDFEPDTFGHHLYRPEFLVNNGIKYVYHCRGSKQGPIYRFFSPSGKNVLCYREENWYLGPIEYNDFSYVPKFCKDNKINCALKVYGVGDHGGGSTVRDVLRIIEMSKWPLLPTIKFGTLHEFFKNIEEMQRISEFRGEHNTVFSGCYSSNYEIKKQNFITESNLRKAEIWCNFDKSTNYKFDDALEAYLPTHFHDIITGSNVASAKYFALGQYQVALSRIGENKALALKNIAKQINTSSIYSSNKVDVSNISIGAAGGFLNKENNFSASLGYGKERAFAIFNSSNIERNEIINIQVWDYYGDINKLVAYDENGKKLPFSLRHANPFFYWYHNCHTFAVYVKVPALGYTTIILKEEEKLSPLPVAPHPRIEDPKSDIVLENSIIKAIFDKNTAELKYFYKNDKEVAKNGHFEFIIEDASEWMTAWLIGRFKSTKTISNFTYIPGSYFKNDVQQGFSLRTTFENSNMTLHITLDKDDVSLKYDMELGFYEVASYEKGIPMVRFVITPSNKSEFATYNIPGGFINREPADINYPALSLISTENVGIFGEGPHGYRYDSETISMVLIRNTIDPFMNPELGVSNFTFRLFADDNLHRVMDKYTNKLDYVLLDYQTTNEPLSKSFANVDERLMLHTITNDEVVVSNISTENEFIINSKKVKLKDYETNKIKL